MKNFALVLFFVFGTSLTFAQITTVTSVQSGDWNDPATWDAGRVPNENDYVYVAAGHTVTIDANAECEYLFIFGSLQFGDGGPFTLEALDISVLSGGVMSRSDLGLAVHLLLVSGDITNHGTVDLNNSTNTAGVNITATGSVNGTISGSGTTDVREITVDKTSGTDTSAASKLTLSLDNTTVQGTSSGAPPFITLLNGELEISGNNPFSSPLFVSPSNTIGSGDVLTINNPNFTVTGQNGSLTIGNDGKLHIIQGTLNVGTSSNNSLTYTSGAMIVIEGGTTNVYGAFCPSSSSNSFTFEQTGGVLNVLGNHTSTTAASLDFATSSFTSFTFTGGTQVIANPTAAASGPRDYRGPSTAATLNVTAGGTLQFGDATSVSPTTFNVQGVLPNFDFNPVVDRTLQLQGTTTLLLPATIPDGATIILNGRTLNVRQDLTIAAGGELNGNTSSSALGFTGSVVQTFTNNGTITNGYVRGLTINNTSVSSPSVSLSSNVEITNTLTLSSGILGGSGTLTLGNSTVSNNMTVIRSGGAILNTPAFNLTGVTYNVTYTSASPGPTPNITTSNELPSSISGALTINNANGVTLNGASGVDQLILTSGTLTTTNTNLLTINGGDGNDVIGGSSSSFVNGPLVRSLPPSLVAGTTYPFPIGEGSYNGVTLVDPTTTSGGWVLIKADVSDGNSGGTAGSGLSSINTDQSWELTIVSGPGNFTNTKIRLTDTGVAGGNRIGQSSTQAGTYNSIGGTVSGSSITSTSTLTGLDFFIIGTTPDTFTGTYTVGASGADYPTITAAVNDVTGGVFTGPVVLNLLDASYPSETFPISIPPISGSSAVNTLTIQPASGVSPAISGNSSTSIFKFDGSDFVIIDGSNNGTSSRDMTIANTFFSDGTAGVWLSSSGSGVGASNNTIKNCNISAGADQTTSNTFSYGILSSGTSVVLSNDGADNDNNLFQNNFITKARYGIYLRGASGNPNDGNMITSNLIGPAAFGSTQIGKGGIVVQHQSGLTISNNEVRSVGSSSGIPEAASADRVGIGIGADDWLLLTGFTTITNSTISGNSVHDIIEEKTRSAVGINVAGSGSPTNNTIANNMIYNIRSNGTSGEQGAGIGVAAGNGDKIVFNSILLEGDIDPSGSTTATGSTAGIRVGNFSSSNLTLKNNIISVDVNSNTGSLNHYAIVVTSTSYSWGTGGPDYNNYYINTSNTQMKLGGTGTSIPYSAVSDLAAWKTTLSPNRDANSKSFAPDLTSATDLHLNIGTLNSDYIGTPIAGVTADFDSETRNASYPYIGADEDLGFPLPVELASFNASASAHNVMLRWTTATEANNYGFEVQRKQIPLNPPLQGGSRTRTADEAGGFNSVGFVEGNGTSNSPKEYSFIDRKLNSGKYSYRLKQIDRNGKFTYSQEVEIMISQIPQMFALMQNFPNPFNPTTEIRYQMPEASMVSLKIYDMLGREVATLVNEMKEAGSYDVKFDASRLSTGVYIYMLRAGNFTATKKLMLMK